MTYFGIFENMNWVEKFNLICPQVNKSMNTNNNYAVGTGNLHYRIVSVKATHKDDLKYL